MKYKFRGKTEYDERWVYGGCCVDEDGTTWILTKDNPYPSIKLDKNTDGHYAHIVIPETVGQLICEEDGNEYYEGDKVKVYRFNYEGGDAKPIIGILGKDSGGTFVKDEETEEYTYLLSLELDLYMFTEHVEVIGTIHDSKEGE